MAKTAAWVVTVLPAKVVSAPRVRASPKVWAPVVRMLAPLSTVLPPASVVKLASRSPSVPAAPVPPMAPVRVVVALSLIVKLRAVPSDLTVLPRVMPTPLRVVSVPRVAAPVYVCVPLLLMAPVLIAVVPLTDKVLKPLTVSSLLLPSTALPAIVKALPPPATVPWVLTVVPVKVVSALKVSAPP